MEDCSHLNGIQTNINKAWLGWGLSLTFPLNFIMWKYIHNLDKKDRIVMNVTKSLKHLSLISDLLYATLDHLVILTDANLEPSWETTMEFFAKILNG